MMTLLTYKGWRLICLSLLPIDKSTIVYGSVDGGASVFNEDKILNEKMKNAGKLLNLKPHKVGLKVKKEIYSCVDLEGHKGRDGKFYLLDFARVAPPTPPTQPGENLYHLFRMEFVTKYSKPLSPDSFSRMGRDGQKEHCQDIIEAFNHLQEVTIPQFAKDLEPFRPDYCKIHHNAQFDFDGIVLNMHSAGINLRYAGRLRKYFTHEWFKVNMLRFAIYRVGKTLLHKTMRDISKQTGNVAPYNRVIVHFLNLFCGFKVILANSFFLHLLFCEPQFVKHNPSDKFNLFVTLINIIFSTQKLKGERISRILQFLFETRNLKEIPRHLERRRKTNRF